MKIVIYRPNLSDWIQFLISKKIRCAMWIIGDFSACFVLLSIIALIFFNYGIYYGFTINTPLTMLFLYILYLGFGRFPDFRKSTKLLNEIMNEEKNDIEKIKEEWFNRRQKMVKKKKVYNYGLYFKEFLILGAIFLGIGFIFGLIAFLGINIQYWETTSAFGFGFFSIGTGLIGISIAFHSADIANKSDKKMIALAELNFIEKNATICNYIVNSTIEGKDIERIIRDLEAGYKVIEWVEDNNTKINYIDALIKLTKILLQKKIIQNIEEPFKIDYKMILENSKKFKHEIDEIEILKKKF